MIYYYGTACTFVNDSAVSSLALQQDDPIDVLLPAASHDPSMIGDIDEGRLHRP